MINIWVMRQQLQQILGMVVLQLPAQLRRRLLVTQKTGWLALLAQWSWTSLVGMCSLPQQS